MLRSRALWPTLTLAALLVACTPQETADVTEEMTSAAPQVDMAAIATAMDQTEAAFVEAYNARDAAGIAALFAADGAQSPPLSPRLDQAGIEAAYAETLAAEATFDLTVEREDFFTNAAGDMVVSWGAFAVTVTPAEGEAFAANGRYGVVSRLQSDGTWKIYRHIFNYEVPPPGLGE